MVQSDAVIWKQYTKSSVFCGKPTARLRRSHWTFSRQTNHDETFLFSLAFFGAIAAFESPALQMIACAGAFLCGNILRAQVLALRGGILDRMGKIIHIASANDTLYAAASGAFFRLNGTSWTDER